MLSSGAWYTSNEETMKLVQNLGCPMHPPAHDLLKQLESQVQHQLGNRLFEFRLSWNEDGLILEGQTRSYHVKQLAQEALREATTLPISLNDIQVC